MDESISDSQWICLNELKDIRFKYLENEQSLNLQVPPHMMTGYSVDLKGQQITSPQLLKIKPLNAAILNYSLYHTITNDENVFSGSAEEFSTVRSVTFRLVCYITEMMKIVIATKNGYVWKVNGNM